MRAFSRWIRFLPPTSGERRRDTGHDPDRPGHDPARYGERTLPSVSGARCGDKRSRRKVPFLKNVAALNLFWRIGPEIGCVKNASSVGNVAISVKILHTVELPFAWGLGLWIWVSSTEAARKEDKGPCCDGSKPKTSSPKPHTPNSNCNSISQFTTLKNKAGEYRLRMAEGTLLRWPCPRTLK